MVDRLLEKLLEFPEVSRIIVTQNIPESSNYPANSRISVVENVLPKGFGANHNAAFQMCREGFFCVLNPDIEFLVIRFHCCLRRLGWSELLSLRPWWFRRPVWLKTASGIFRAPARC